MLKITQLFINTTIDPHPTIFPQSSLTLLPDQNNASKINLDPIKDSALNIVSLNIHSLTIKEDSIKLKRIFKLDAAIIVLTEVSVNGSAYSKLCRLWREQISRYQVWYTGTDYRGIMILVKKSRKAEICPIRFFIYQNPCLGVANFLSWAVTKYCVGVGWAVTKY